MLLGAQSEGTDHGLITPLRRHQVEIEPYMSHPGDGQAASSAIVEPGKQNGSRDNLNGNLVLSKRVG